MSRQSKLLSSCSPSLGVPHCSPYPGVFLRQQTRLRKATLGSRLIGKERQGSPTGHRQLWQSLPELGSIYTEVCESLPCLQF